MEPVQATLSHNDSAPAAENRLIQKGSGDGSVAHRNSRTPLDLVTPSRSAAHLSTCELNSDAYQRSPRSSSVSASGQSPSVRSASSRVSQQNSSSTYPSSGYRPSYDTSSFDPRLMALLRAPRHSSISPPSDISLPPPAMPTSEPLRRKHTETACAHCSVHKV